MTLRVKENVILEKSFRFALETKQFCRRLRVIQEYDLARQLFKSGTSIGANVEEAQAAQSRPDFLSKMSIASKEARESRYWLRLLNEDTTCDLKPDAAYFSECEEIVRILTSIVKSTGES